MRITEPAMIILNDLFRTRTLEASALHLVNQLLHNKPKTYLNNQGTYWDFGNHLTRNLQRIHKALHNRTYTFSPYIKRSKKVKLNKVRDLYHPTWPDRIVERWLSETLGRHLHHWFSKNSYAYRIRDYCIDNCQWAVLRAIAPDSFIIKRDITNCFYTIHHDHLLKQIRQLVDPNDYLYELLRQRIQFHYKIDTEEIHTATIGVPFGSSLACILANIALTPIDRALDKLPIKYFRYADDFLIVASTAERATEAASTLDQAIASLEMTTKPSHSLNISFRKQEGFLKVSKFPYLGIEFTAAGLARLGRAKARKIINLVKRELSYTKLDGELTAKIAKCVAAANRALVGKIRSVAIVDYYLKHVTDERQLRELDLLIAQLVVSKVLGKPFRYRDFSKVSFKRLRQAGLTSLMHRRRLHAHGQIDVRFMELYNQLVHDRFETTHKSRQDRINHARLGRSIIKHAKH